MSDEEMRERLIEAISSSADVTAMDARDAADAVLRVVKAALVTLAQERDAERRLSAQLKREVDANIARAERWDTEAAAARIIIPRLEAERDAARAEVERLRQCAAALLAQRDMECAGCAGPSANPAEFPDYLNEALKELDVALGAKMASREDILANPVKAFLEGRISGADLDAIE